MSFSHEFLVSTNENHYSNKEKSLKMLKHIMIPYVEYQHWLLNLNFNQPVSETYSEPCKTLHLRCLTEFLICLCGFSHYRRFQRDSLKEKNVILEKVIANRTYISQPLDVQSRGVFRSQSSIYDGFFFDNS